MKNNKWKIQGAFTLVELLVVLAILSILATVTLAAFNSSQARGRDTQRKSDLKQIANSLELYYSDYGTYPASDGAGKIEGCPSTSATVCIWGTGSFTDLKTIYFKILPKDPVAAQNYFYRTITVGSVNQGFQLFAHLENSQDPQCLAKNCVNPAVPAGVTCGNNIACNLSITSANVKATD